MAWLLGMIGAFFGLAIAEVGSGFAAFVAGALIGALFGKVSNLKRRVAELEAGRAPGDTRRVATAVDAANVATATQPAPVVARPATPPAIEPAPVDAPAAWPDAPVAAAAPAAPRLVEPAPDAAPKPVFTASEPRAPAESPAMASAAAPDAATRERIAGAAARVAAGQGAFTPSEPREPDWTQKATTAIKRWFTEGNVPVKVGMIVLFVGVAALLKYAVDNGLLQIPVEVWFALVGALGLASLVFGWRQREERRAFGLAMQGGGIGILLITVFSAFRLYQLMPAGAAFLMVALLVGGSALLAILQNAVALAVLGFLGGYLAPVLISTGSGNHVALFSYYAILNAAVFAVAWVRPWRALNLIGFFFTFAVGLAWGERYYEPEKFGTVEPFLILFTLFYIGIGVLYPLRQPEAKRGLVDGTLVFGTPLLAFPLQAALLKGDDMGLAFSALALALVYAILCAWLLRRDGMRVLAESFAALAVGFATLAVPLALSAQWTATTWALEGAALAWLGLRQDRFLPRFAGVSLQFLAGLAWCWALFDHGWRTTPEEMWVLNGRCLGALLIAVAGWTTSFLYERYRPGRHVVVVAAFLWAAWWWVWAVVGEIDTHVAHPHEASAFVAATLLTMLLAVVFRRAVDWPRLGWLALAGFPTAIMLAFASNAQNDGVFGQYGLHAWIPFLLLAPWVLHRLREPRQRGLSIGHVLFLALVPLLAALALDSWTQTQADMADGWRFTLPWLPFLAMTLLTWRAPRVSTAPLADLFPQYALRWFGPVAVLLTLAWALSLQQEGAAAPLPFVPLVNPVELLQAAILVTLWMLMRDRVLTPADAKLDGLRNVLLFAAFVSLTFATLRAVHHLYGAPWSPAILDDRVAQTGLSVVWTIVGAAAWIAGSKLRSRPVWLAGAILLGVVVAKLFMVDWQHTGTIAGIVSFMAVGGLIVAMGYFAPSPPRARDDEPQPVEGARP